MSTRAQEAGGCAPRKVSVCDLVLVPKDRKYAEMVCDAARPTGRDIELVAHPSQQSEFEEDIEDLQKRFNIKEFKMKLRLAEALAKASDMTSPAAKRRLEAKKLDLDMAQDNGPVFLDENAEEYTPPRELLIYIMR